MVAAINAYIADVTLPRDRSRLFSLGAGLLFVGMAFGPTIGAVLVRATRMTMVVFYLATVLHALLALYVWVIVPESLSKSAQLANRQRAERTRVERIREEDQAALVQDLQENRKASFVKILGRTQIVSSFLSPLSILAPVTIENTGSGKKRKDWSLTLIAAGFGCSMLVLVSLASLIRPRNFDMYPDLGFVSI